MRRTTKRAGADLRLDDDLLTSTAPSRARDERPRADARWEAADGPDGSDDFEAEGAAPAEEAAEGQAPDDALGLYLRQMGAIPLLTRQQELALAQRLERVRRRYRRAALANWQ